MGNNGFTYASNKHFNQTWIAVFYNQVFLGNIIVREGCYEIATTGETFKSMYEAGWYMRDGMVKEATKQVTKYTQYIDYLTRK